MRFLIVDPTYPEHEDQAEGFRNSLTDAVAEHFGGKAALREVDAGPSASIPAFLLDLAGTLSDVGGALAFPIVAREAVSWWKDRFQAATAFLNQLKVTYAVDLRSAALLAVWKTLDAEPVADAAEVHAITRHWMNLGGPGADFISPDQLNAAYSSAPLDEHFTAVQQLACHYALLVTVDSRAFTAIVEREGTISYLEEL